jgi:cytochrome P450
MKSRFGVASNCPGPHVDRALPREDISLADVVIPRGSFVFAVLSSTNRDETHFDRPEELDITRDPNRHPAFGLGIHFCIGAPLARAESQTALNTLLRRTGDLCLAVPPPAALKCRRGPVLRGLKSLPLGANVNR